MSPARQSVLRSAFECVLPGAPFLRSMMKITGSSTSAPSAERAAWKVNGPMWSMLTLCATKAAPLRHNSVETFDEYNTKRNVGKGTPTVFWEIVPESDSCEIYTYMAGGGCSLPGKAMVLMPGAGYEGVTRFVLDQMTSYGLNACPPLLVGVGVATSVETAALLSKKALMRPIGSHNPNARAAEMEKLLEDGINSIGLGPQGMSGCASVMGVHIENTARHPSTIGVAVNVGCWSHRRGLVRFDRDLNATVISHKGVTL